MLRAWRPVRLVLRLSLCILATAALATTWFVARPLFARTPDRRRALRGYVFAQWSGTCLARLGVRLHVEGAPPRERCFLVANHLSYLDILVLASQMNCVFLSMAELEDWPFIGLMARSFGTVFIDRQRKRDIPDVIRELENFIEQGFIVVLFPEGKSSRGERVDEFRPALLEPAAQSRHPVACATLRYATGPRDEPASNSVCWTTPRFISHLLRLSMNDRIDASLILHPDVIRHSNRKALADELQRKVESRFVPME